MLVVPRPPVDRFATADDPISSTADYCSAADWLDRYGRVPLPPYIRDGHMVDADVENYQTVFARSPGSVAAPTAGLHFTPSLLGQITDGGTEMASVTLHVGLGTFRPVSSETLDEHQMHTEWGQISEENAELVKERRCRRGTMRCGRHDQCPSARECCEGPGRRFAGLDSDHGPVHSPAVPVSNRRRVDDELSFAKEHAVGSGQCLRQSRIDAGGLREGHRKRIPVLQLRGCDADRVDRTPQKQHDDRRNHREPRPSVSRH